MSHVQPGINDLVTISPNLLDEWDYEKNINIDPHEVSAKGNKKIWWKCSLGHSWEASPDHRARGYNCPFCSGKRVLAGFNDLKSKCPALEIDWDYEKNTEFGPDELTVGSKKDVWWKCHECGHSWKCSPNSRKSGLRGCPQCAEEKRRTSYLESRLHKGENDLVSQAPDIAADWDYERNIDLEPESFTVKSKRKVWWKCKLCGNSWEATIKNRTMNGSGCPKCRQHKRTSFPEQALFFYLKKQYRETENSYSAFENSKMEIDIYIPNIKTGIEYDGVAWHTNSKSQERDHKKYVMCQELGIKLIRVAEFKPDTMEADQLFIREDSSDRSLNNVIKQVLSALKVDCDVDISRDRAEIMQLYIKHIEDKSISSRYPEDVKYWDVEKNNGVTTDMVNATSNVSYWWKCDLGHSYKASPSNRLGTGNGCPFCSGKRVLKGFNDLVTKYPEIAAEWDYEKNTGLSPNEISGGSAKEVWWKCGLGHSYKVSPNGRVYNKSRCPYCSNIKVLAGFNDLKTKYPNVADKWSYENNKKRPEEVLYNSHEIAVWHCEKGHIWKRTVSAEINYDGCPTCLGKDLLVGFNDLDTLYPDLVKDWNYEKNEKVPQDYTRLAKDKVWWKCHDCGNEWQAVIYTRIFSGTGCPKCGNAKKQKETNLAKAKAAGNTLDQKFPEIAAEWDYEKNDFSPSDVTPAANKKVWWICKKKHSYQAWLSDRTGKLKTGCPYCAGKRKLNS